MALADRLSSYFDEKINDRLRGVSRTANLDVILEQIGLGDFFDAIDDDNRMPEKEKCLLLLCPLLKVDGKQKIKWIATTLSVSTTSKRKAQKALDEIRIQYERKYVPMGRMCSKRSPASTHCR